VEDVERARGASARREERHAPRRWWRARELATIVVLGVMAGGAWTFVELAEEVRGDALVAFDRTVLLAMRTPGDPADPIGPRWFEELARDVTALGGVAVVTFVTLSAALFLWLIGSRSAALLLLAAVLGGELLSSALKLGFGRPRPDLVPHETTVYTASFPSGHAMLSAVAYLTIGALVARVRPERSVKAFAAAWSVLVTLLVGASRVYLGVHWPTDVLAGWAAGAAWAALCWTVADVLRRRGRLRAEGAG
jgi:undecaprenyl-diphosphatase